MHLHRSPDMHCVHHRERGDRPAHPPIMSDAMAVDASKGHHDAASATSTSTLASSIDVSCNVTPTSTLASSIDVSCNVTPMAAKNSVPSGHDRKQHGDSSATLASSSSSLSILCNVRAMLSSESPLKNRQRDSYVSLASAPGAEVHMEHGGDTEGCAGALCVLQGHFAPGDTDSCSSPESSASDQSLCLDDMPLGGHRRHTELCCDGDWPPPAHRDREPDDGGDGGGDGAPGNLQTSFWHQRTQCGTSRNMQHNSSSSSNNNSMDSSSSSISTRTTVRARPVGAVIRKLTGLAAKGHVMSPLETELGTDKRMRDLACVFDLFLHNVRATPWQPPRTATLMRIHHRGTGIQLAEASAVYGAHTKCNCFFVRRIEQDSVAALDGSISVGDIVCSVNEVPLAGMTLAEAHAECDAGAKATCIVFQACEEGRRVLGPRYLDTVDTGARAQTAASTGTGMPGPVNAPVALLIAPNPDDIDADERLVPIDTTPLNGSALSICSLLELDSTCTGMRTTERQQKRDRMLAAAFAADSIALGDAGDVGPPDDGFVSPRTVHEPVPLMTGMATCALDEISLCNPDETLRTYSSCCTATPDSALDGRGWTAAPGAAGPHWIQFSLAAPLVITGCVVQGSAPGAAHVTHIAVSVLAADGKTWTVIADDVPTLCTPAVAAKRFTVALGADCVCAATEIRVIARRWEGGTRPHMRCALLTYPVSGRQGLKPRARASAQLWAPRKMFGLGMRPNSGQVAQA